MSAQKPVDVDLVPGVVRCAKCSFQLHRIVLYMGNGTTGPGDSETEPCPNGCGPLWPVTWKQWAKEAIATSERFFDEAHIAREELAAVNVELDERRARDAAVEELVAAATEVEADAASLGMTTTRLTAALTAWRGGAAVGAATSVNAEMLAVLEELRDSAAYWSEYDVPLGIVDRINTAIANARGVKPEGAG